MAARDVSVRVQRDGVTLHEFVDAAEWPTNSTGFRIGARGRVVWTGAYYPDGASGNVVKVHRIVHERGNVFTRVAFYDRDCEIVFVTKEAAI